MASQFFSTRTVEDVAEAYVASQGKMQYVSTTLAIRAIRALMPETKSTDREIADIIAAASIRHNVAVAFDSVTLKEIPTDEDGAFLSQASGSSL